MYSTPSSLLFATFVAFTASASAERVGKRCTGTISSLSDVAAAVECTTININSFTVTAGETFDLELATGTTVNLLGDVTFGVSNWAGPLFQIAGTSVTFNGNGHTFNGNGPSYWDGQGGNGGVTKPKFMKIKNSGVFTNLKILNSPVHVFSVGGSGPLTISSITIDDSAGDAANSASGGDPAGHNTDGFDVSANNILIKDCVVMNQDDCLAINKGSNITFQNNKCSGGHGISIGSISSSVTVSDIYITGNTVTDSDNGLRIKMDADATGSTVSGVYYTGNTLSTIHKYGVLIDQSYPDTLGTPGTGVILSNVQFISGNTVSVDSSATRVAVNCGSGACTGTWNWSGLAASGGKTGTVNYSGITGFSNTGTTTTTTKSSTTTTKTTTTTTKTSTTTSPTTSKTTTTTTKTTTTSASSTGTVAAYGQCGGIGYTGPTTCVSGWTCVYSNDYYSQCVQA
ncbi:carbohydrate-binding module family 1 protein [Tulasnella calospora MUT 4182]|uniref:endo-polygalacturonase n=1 Tax=Tulasnella calospora MUT 4182 TaxID=1051891 RepID=A0A0C3QH71_9AGAM|nr:carbohydrate-binding module family 1 protein [Tulasnella calospora MUT 4182]